MPARMIAVRCKTCLKEMGEEERGAKWVGNVIYSLCDDCKPKPKRKRRIRRLRKRTS